MLVTEYHKSQNIMDEPKVIPRFLTPKISTFLVAYLSEILPFLQLLDRTKDVATTKGLIFSANGEPWLTKRLTDVLVRESSKRIGFRLNTQDYRHIAIAIDRQHVRALGTCNGAAEEDNAHDLQASHGTAQAEMLYGLRSDMLKSLTAQSVDKFRQVSRRWHMFLELESTPEAASATAATAVTSKKRTGTRLESERTPEATSAAAATTVTAKKRTGPHLESERIKRSQPTCVEMNKNKNQRRVLSRARRGHRLRARLERSERAEARGSGEDKVNAGPMGRRLS